MIVAGPAVGNFFNRWYSKEYLCVGARELKDVKGWEGGGVERGREGGRGEAEAQLPYVCEVCQEIVCLRHIRVHLYSSWHTYSCAVHRFTKRQQPPYIHRVAAVSLMHVYSLIRVIQYMNRCRHVRDLFAKRHHATLPYKLGPDAASVDVRMHPERECGDLAAKLRFARCRQRRVLDPPGDAHCRGEYAEA